MTKRFNLWLLTILIVLCFLPGQEREPKLNSNTKVENKNYQLSILPLAPPEILKSSPVLIVNPLKPIESKTVSKIDLIFQTNLFESIKNQSISQTKKKDLAIAFIANCYNFASEEKAQGQIEALQQFFPEIKLNQQFLPIKINWSKVEEIYEAGGKFLGQQEKTTGEKFYQELYLDNEKYRFWLIPKSIDIKAKRYVFQIEMEKLSVEKGSVCSAKTIVSKEILWNFGGPLFLTLIAEPKIYLLAITIRLDWSSSGGRLGAGLSMII